MAHIPSRKWRMRLMVMRCAPVRGRHRGEKRVHLLSYVVLFFLTCFLLPKLCWSQETLHAANIQVRYDQSEGPISPVWNYFGYDEPNYTYAPNGRKLLDELAAANPVPVYVRTHNLLTSGDG